MDVYKDSEENSANIVNVFSLTFILFKQEVNEPHRSPEQRFFVSFYFSFLIFPYIFQC